MGVAEKQKAVEEFCEELGRYRTICLADMRYLKAAQFKELRGKMKSVARVIVLRKNIVRRAIAKKFGENSELLKLLDDPELMPVILLSSESSFKIKKLLESSKVEIFAKPGDIAEEDVVISPGPTNLVAGPIISELAKFNIKTKVEGGKITITNEVKLLKAGDQITQEVSELLKKLDIKAKRITLRLVASLEDGKFFDLREVVVSESYYIGELQRGLREAFNLSLRLDYVTRENIGMLLQKYHTLSLNFALKASIISPETVKNLLLTGFSHMLALAYKLSLVRPDAISPELKEMLIELRLKELFGG